MKTETKKKQSNKVVVKQTKPKEEVVIVTKINNDPVRIIVDFKTVWAFMWRWIAIIIALYIPIIIVTIMLGAL